MQEELIESLIQVEKDARELEVEGQNEVEKLRQNYRQRMEEEEKERLHKAREKGEQLVQETEKETQRYAAQVEKNIKEELNEMIVKFEEIHDTMLNKFFQKIIKSEGV